MISNTQKESNNSTENLEPIFLLLVRLFSSLSSFFASIVKVETLKMIMHTQLFWTKEMWTKSRNFPDKTRRIKKPL